MASDFSIAADLKAKGTLCADAAVAFAVRADLHAQGQLDADGYYNETVRWANVETRNVANLAHWRRKMRCKAAVESVGEYGSYRDLRNAEQLMSWSHISTGLTLIRWGLYRRHAGGDPDILAGADSRPTSS